MCPASHAGALESSPDHGRGDVASCTAHRAILPAWPHLLYDIRIQAARGTQSPWEATQCPCPSSPESFKQRSRTFNVLIPRAS